MSGWTLKRFWAEATAAPVPGGFAIHLDGRPVITPAKSLLVVPSPTLAKAIAAEWDAQQGKVDPESMPLTRAANSALDKVMPQFAAVAEMIAAYGDSDLLCYRADSPASLVARQAEDWDPLLAWAASDLGAPLTPVSGVMHRPQLPESLSALRGHVEAQDPFALTALHDLVALSGSLVIGLAALREAFKPDDLWLCSRIDERWQAEVWGADDEAAATEAKKRAAFFQALTFHQLARA